MPSIFGFQIKSISYGIIFISLLSSALFILYMHYGLSKKWQIRTSENPSVIPFNYSIKGKIFNFSQNSTVTTKNEFTMENLIKNKTVLKKHEKLRTPAFINVLVIFSNLKNNRLLKVKLTTCLSSLLSLTTIPLKLHILGDFGSQLIAEKIAHREIYKSNAKVELLWHDVEEFTDHLNPALEAMQQVFSKPGAYYSHTLFYLSTIIHRFLTVHHIIALDIDIKLQDNIWHLYQHFQNFKPKNLIGLAYEQQPVYRHTFHVYRSIHPNTRVGSPSPDGLPGFNSGVLLLDLKKMRHSHLYNSFLNNTVIKQLSTKYRFQGHLGDQDFFTLLSLEHEELFYVLPCSWNRQLCKWWKGHGYQDVFEQYNKCSEPIKLYHGNCNSPIP